MSDKLKLRALGIAVLASLLLAPALLAQNPTGTLTGRVTDADGGALPGVTVTATSPSLQGSRVTESGANGDYKLAFLPPGTYRVTYELSGFSTVARDVKISAAQSMTSNVELGIAEVVEEIVVTSRLSTISETPTGSSTLTKDEVEKLPIARNIEEATLLTPGVFDTGPGARTSNDDTNGNIAIAGAMSFENLWLVNGVVLNENIRGQSLPLFIEDAIEETTTSVSGISAEYGRFTGGVINAITKSGGNEFSGSGRVSLSNDSWQSETDLTPAQTDEITETYEGTLGGFLWKDHAWFFAAGRDRALSETRSTSVTNIGFPSTNEETRVEGKLTVTPHPSHTLIGSYFEIDESSTNTVFGTILDLDSVNPVREDPQEIKSINYTGILTPSFFVEAQYSERDFIIGRGGGGPQDQIFGTLMRHRQSGVRFFSPTFCGACEDEIRNNENALIKGSYFLTTENAGTHDMSFGYDTFDDVRFAVNHQTGSDFTIYATNYLIDSQNNVFPVLNPNAPSSTLPWIRWFAVFNLDIAQPTSFTTNSFYANDRWQLNDKWSFNLGVRYDENDGTNSAGALVASDSKVSPRLGLNYDLKGDGDLLINASYGTYVAAVANNQADSTSSGGAIGSFVWLYRGPAINTDANCINTGTCTPTAEALQILFDWYQSLGGTFDSVFNIAPNAPINAHNIDASIPGETSIIPGSIQSPSADEYTLGFNKRLGTKGSLRADLVYRQWDDFYSNKTTLETGQVDTPAGPTDLTHVGNFSNDILEREYIGLHTQARYRVTDKLTLAAVYALSQLEGNINGETDVNGPISESPRNYPEYRENRWSFPVGNLLGDSRHRLRGWAIYDIFNTEHHALSVSLLQSFSSGTPYGAVTTIDSSPFVVNPGYAQPPTAITYYFTDRDAFQNDDITRTDLSFNYAFKWNLWGKEMDVFLQPEVINLFDESGVVDEVDDIVLLEDFDPFTETPVEGVHWRKANNFGEADNQLDYQQPRTYRFSVGLRFN